MKKWMVRRSPLPLPFATYSIATGNDDASLWIEETCPSAGSGKGSAPVLKVENPEYEKRDNYLDGLLGVLNAPNGSFVEPKIDHLVSNNGHYQLTVADVDSTSPQIDGETTSSPVGDSALPSAFGWGSFGELLPNTAFPDSLSAQGKFPNESSTHREVPVNERTLYQSFWE